MQKMKLIVALALVVALGGGLAYWWHYQSLYPATQDAFLRAHIVSISSQVTGEVASVDVHENELVRKGQVLFRIDAGRYRNAFDAAQAQERIAEDALNASTSEIAAARQSVASAQSTLDAATKALDRTRSLLANGNTTQATLDQQQAAEGQARAALDAARAQLTQAVSTRQSRQDSLTAAKAQVATASLDLGHTVVRAPADGWVSNLSLRSGATVTEYQPLFALVESAHWWVEANFKETDLSRIRPGQSVNVTAALLPGVTLKGHVASVGFGSGSSFALLPAENSSGNWVKVTQRFPIRIALDKTDAVLRTGASVTARIDTTSGSGTVQQAAK